jgi:hypothetical protein
MIAVLAVGWAEVWAQEPQSPPVQLNLVNSCTPGEAEKAEIAAALGRIPSRPAFATDFEVARGRTTGKDGPADWVRLRRDFAAGNPVSSVQYLLSAGSGGIDESLVFHYKASKPGEALQLSLEDQVSAGSAAAVPASDTPPAKIRLERFGKPSLILARCPEADQRAYEPLFRTAAAAAAEYRTALKAAETVPAELARIKRK